MRDLAFLNDKLHSFTTFHILMLLQNGTYYLNLDEKIEVKMRVDVINLYIFQACFILIYYLNFLILRL